MQDTPENKQQEEVLKEELRFSFSQFFTSLLNYAKNVVNIRDGIDVEGSTESVRQDIDFKGPSVWILGASIVIASIGLNVNSTALIIGAMLISPLMGPIVGMGFAVGTNNWTMLTRSIKSLGTAVIISILISALYFLITPFGEVQSELIARTKPNLLDVLVAIFGGLALIVAKTKKGTIASVIFGVAIATALMPPLCTAGYGLANGNWPFFFGAFYLFLINSVFISLTTWMIVRYLRFPLATYINQDRQKKVKRYIILFSLLVMIPSTFTFWNTIQESLFRRNAQQFLTENFVFEGSDIINKKLIYNGDDGTNNIEVYMIGEIIPEQTEKRLMRKLEQYDLGNTTFKIHQSKDKTDELTGKLSAEVKTGILEEIYTKNQTLIESKDEKIDYLENELVQFKKDSVPFHALKKEIKIQYQEITSLAYGKTIHTAFDSLPQDTTLTFFTQWNEKLPAKEVDKNTSALQDWLRVRLNDKKVKVVTF